jgi:hypothetical protein
MSFFDDLKAKADRNDDGKINMDDLESLRGGDNDGLIDRLKEKAAGSDGKLDMDDVKSQLSDWSDKAKDSIGSLFGNK